MKQKQQNQQQQQKPGRGWTFEPRTFSKKLELGITTANQTMGRIARLRLRGLSFAQKVATIILTPIWITLVITFAGIVLIGLINFIIVVIIVRIIDALD